MIDLVDNPAKQLGDVRLGSILLQKSVEAGDEP